MIGRVFKRLFGARVVALFRKELNQIRRDRRLALSLIVPPVLQLTLFGFALSARVENVRLGVVDESHSKESRDLIAVLTESKSFQLAGYYFAVEEMSQAISKGSLLAGVVIPHDFARDLYRGRPTTVQFLLNATRTRPRLVRVTRKRSSKTTTPACKVKAFNHRFVKPLTLAQR